MSYVATSCVRRTGRGRRQAGSALVIGMIFLLIMTVAAVTMMSSSVQDERMTGNTRRASNAFLAAEAGMGDSLGQMDEKSWYDYRCNADGSLEVMVDGQYVAVPDPFITNDSYTDSSGYVVTYLNECDNEGSGFITSLKFRSAGDELDAFRQVEYSMSHGKASFPALFLNDNGHCTFDAGPSSSYNFQGNGGPAVSTGSGQCKSDVETAIEGKEAQYSGGVIHQNPAPDFHTAEGLQDFYNSLIPAAADPCGDFGTAAYASDSCVTGNLHMHRSPAVSYHQNHGFSTTPVYAKDIDDADGTMGSTGDERTYIVHGDLNSTGSIQGAGLLLITGDAYFGGTPDWEGIIIVLGGLAEIGGGGNPGTGFNGTMIISDIEYAPLPSPTGNNATAQELEDYKKHAGFYPQDASNWVLGGAGEIHWDVAGGGGGTYQYDCMALRTSHQMLVAMGADMSDFEEPDCSSGSSGTFGNSFITDWYEVVR